MKKLTSRATSRINYIQLPNLYELNCNVRFPLTWPGRFLGLAVYISLYQQYEYLWNCIEAKTTKTCTTRIWANAQRDGRPAEYRWRPLFNAAKFG